MDIRVLALGDGAFTIEFPKIKGAEGARRVRALRDRIEQEKDKGQLEGLVDVISASRSLSVCIDPLRADITKVRDYVSALAIEPVDEVSEATEHWTLPVCYQGEYAPDLADIAERSGLSEQEVINLHKGQSYNVLMIGFLPGFPFMAEVSKILQFPRRTSPRVKVPAGSVAIANDQTAIYPWESPGGWHLLARCPVPLFNASWDSPSLLSAGVSIEFDEIGEKDFKTIEADLKAGRLDPFSFKSGDKAK